MKTIDQDILPILSTMECEGEIARFTVGQMDRKTYERVNKVLTALGGKWNRAKKGHVFDGEAIDALTGPIATGGYVDAKEAYQFFPTPPKLAKRLVEIADVGEGDLCLEPSAGEGAIAREIVAAGGVADCVELNPAMIRKLEAEGVYRSVLECNFLGMMPTSNYDAVVMNPPFTRLQDVEHVRLAFGFLKPGGKLVSVMSPSFTFRQDRKAVEFREWAEDVGAEWMENESGAFKASGTLVNTVTFVASNRE